MRKPAVLTLFCSCSLLYMSHGSVYAPLDFEYVEASSHKQSRHAPSVAAFLESRNVTHDDNNPTYSARKTTTGNLYKLCKDEMFYDKISMSDCTGFLISPRLLVTAGHCVPKQCKKDISGYWWFGFTNEAAKSLPQNKTHIYIKQNQLYRCAQNLEHHHIGNAFIDIEQNDYALILLERRVEGIEPLPFRREGRIADGAKLVTIGHPSGFAKTIAANASVTINIHEHYFSADIDSTDGSSGSPVFNEETGIVEGVIARACTGKPSYRIDRREESGCRRLNIDRFYYGGTDVVRITSIPNINKWVALYGE